MASSSSPPLSLIFKVRRCQPELVPPSKPTPREVKLLSDIDDQDGLRFQIPLIFIYRNEPSMAGKDPVQILRDALSQTLVFYYPFAGRLREGPGRKLMVDCTGEGVLFIEADADVTLDQFGEAPHPPFPCFQELLYDVPGSEQITNSPIFLIQVTRLKCGGFIVAVRLNHTMSDGAGLKQFLNAWAEMCKGASRPSVQPVWKRELLMARDPPRITFNHREYEQVLETTKELGTPIIVERSFFFGLAEITALRRLVPFHLRKCTTVDVIAACVWLCHTKALQIDPNDDVRMMVLVNSRARFNPPLPIGYYGNGISYPAVVTIAGKLCGNPFGYAVELIRKAKGEASEEYMHSVADFMVVNGRPLFTTVRSLILSDLTRAKFEEVNFGWGATLYGGVAKGGAAGYFGATFMVPGKNGKGEEGIVLPICLPAEAMKRFAKELDDMIGNQNQLARKKIGLCLTKSAL